MNLNRFQFATRLNRVTRIRLDCQHYGVIYFRVINYIFNIFNRKQYIESAHRQQVHEINMVGQSLRNPVINHPSVRH